MLQKRTGYISYVMNTQTFSQITTQIGETDIFQMTKRQHHSFRPKTIYITSQIPCLAKKGAERMKKSRHYIPLNPQAEHLIQTPGPV